MKLDINKPTHRMVLCGILAACILLLTIVVAVPIPGMAGGYVNLGDTGVYLAAFLLGGPWGAVCAGVGSAFADILLGSVLYAAPTFIIKALMALVAGKLISVWPKGKRIFALMLAGLIMPIGYFVYETFLYGAASAAVGIPANLAQYAVGIVLGVSVIKIAEQLKK